MKPERAIEVLETFMSKSMNSDLIEAINCLIMEYRDKEWHLDLMEEDRLYRDDDVYYEDEY